GHERARLPPRALMDQARRPFFPGSALTLNENRGRAVGDLLDERHHSTKRRTRADHGALPQQGIQALLERAVLLDEVTTLQRLADHALQLRALDRLGEE